jgi:hypothetical protein
MVNVDFDVHRVNNANKWDFWAYFLCTLFSTASSAAPEMCTVSEDVGIKPKTVKTLALTARRSNHSARSHFTFITFSTASSAAPEMCTVSEDVGIEPKTVKTLALTARRSNQSAISHFTSTQHTPPPPPTH